MQGSRAGNILVYRSGSEGQAGSLRYVKKTLGDFGLGGLTANLEGTGFL